MMNFNSRASMHGTFFFEVVLSKIVVKNYFLYCRLFCYRSSVSFSDLFLKYFIYRPVHINVINCSFCILFYCAYGYSCFCSCSCNNYLLNIKTLEYLVLFYIFYFVSYPIHHYAYYISCISSIAFQKP